MGTTRRHRVVSIIGAMIITMGAVAIANTQPVQAVITTYVPLFWRLDPVTVTGQELLLILSLTTAVVLTVLWPLYKPVPRRTLDTITLTEQRVVIAGLLLATLGYFNWSYRLPRATLLAVVLLLGIVLPVWFVRIRTTTGNGDPRALLAGDDIQQMDHIVTETAVDPIGYLSPSSVAGIPDGTRQIAQQTATDGGQTPQTTEIDAYPRLGGLSGLEPTIEQENIDTVVCAFQQADRGEFFNALEVCHRHGVDVKVHREYADDVLTANEDMGTLVDVDITPWDTQDYLLKRLFDIGFAGTGLLVLAPLVVVIAVGIKLDSRGPVLYTQERTAGFGDTFPVYKFRTMIPEGASADPIDDDDNDRITRVGRILRRTHMDEIPQLWAILVGHMSVVGPRATWTEEERLLENKTGGWRKRWFVKPGLTGLAQINDAKSTDPQRKLRYDLRYIREQSFWFDVKIVIRQLWKVFKDVLKTLRGDNPEGDNRTADDD
ncbi:sugar transferase [Salinarchaeum sp. IM2453]|uniref:sugar transferase n=1 Tax=Salinarchaeum sp. IM2453 TaxID=2862870 RepID=UPI001C8291C4|nr:sugar transferase [Salinarchaeum sp. IM2453]QZA89044.1 sugar transferase [Salinarchaeum sp. IM2453]